VLGPLPFGLTFGPLTFGPLTTEEGDCSEAALRQRENTIVTATISPRIYLIHFIGFLSPHHPCGAGHGPDSEDCMAVAAGGIRE